MKAMSVLVSGIRVRPYFLSVHGSVRVAQFPLEHVCVCVCNKISSKEIHLKRKLSRRKWHFLGMSRRRHFGCFFAPAGLTLIITCIFGAK